MVKKKSKFEFKVKPEARWHHCYSNGEISCMYAHTKRRILSEFDGPCVRMVLLAHSDFQRLLKAAEGK